MSFNKNGRAPIVGIPEQKRADTTTQAPPTEPKKDILQPSEPSSPK